MEVRREALLNTASKVCWEWLNGYDRHRKAREYCKCTTCLVERFEDELRLDQHLIGVAKDDVPAGGGERGSDGSSERGPLHPRDLFQ